MPGQCAHPGAVREAPCRSGGLRVRGGHRMGGRHLRHAGGRMGADPGRLERAAAAVLRGGRQADGGPAGRPGGQRARHLPGGHQPLPAGAAGRLHARPAPRDRHRLAGQRLPRRPGGALGGGARALGGGSAAGADACRVRRAVAARGAGGDDRGPGPADPGRDRGRCAVGLRQRLPLAGGLPGGVGRRLRRRRPGHRGHPLGAGHARHLPVGRAARGLPARGGGHSRTRWAPAWATPTPTACASTSSPSTRRDPRDGSHRG